MAKKACFFITYITLIPISLFSQLDWIGVGESGFNIINNSIISSASDIKYSFDEVEGVLFPFGIIDLNDYKSNYQITSVFEITHHVDVYVRNIFGFKTAGIKFAITFRHDNNGAIGNISLAILDVYDSVGWGGEADINITQRSLDPGWGSFRFTINVGFGNVIQNFIGSTRLILRGIDGDIRFEENNLPCNIDLSRFQKVQVYKKPMDEVDRYSTISLGGKTWLAENLHYLADDSYCYSDRLSNCKKYGRLYSLREAKEACAALGDGWRLPTISEWAELVETHRIDGLIMGGRTGFNALLGGYRVSDGSGNSSVEVGNGGYFWTTWSVQDLKREGIWSTIELKEGDQVQVLVHLSKDNEDNPAYIMVSSLPFNFWLSVRCLKE